MCEIGRHLGVRKNIANKWTLYLYPIWRYTHGWHLSYSSCDVRVKTRNPEQINNVGYCRHMVAQYGRLLTSVPALYVNRMVIISKWKLNGYVFLAVGSFKCYRAFKGLPSPSWINSATLKWYKYRLSINAIIVHNSSHVLSLFPPLKLLV